MDSLGVVGNGTYGALINKLGKIVWCGLEGFSGDAIFNSLLNSDSRESGFFEIELVDLARSEQKYIPNTPVLITTLISKNNDVIQIKDFAPKFVNYDRVFRPFQIVRSVTRIRGDPTIRVRIKPSFEFNASDGYTTRGSHHLRFCGKETVWRLTTSFSVQAIIEESLSIVHEPIYFVFGQDESFAGSLSQVCREFEDKTVRYWKEKAQTYALPADYQDMLMRSVIMLSLMQSEESGGFLAALTLGIPNAAFGSATRDRRVCELMDTCLSLSVLRDLGLFAAVKRFIEYVKNASFANPAALSAISRDLGPEFPKEETALEFLSGYKGTGGVVGGFRGHIAGEGLENALVQSLVVIALSHGFFDVRMKDVCSPKLFDRLEKMGDKILHVFGVDAVGQGGLVEEYFEDQPSYYCAGENVTGEGGGWVFGWILMWSALDKLQRVAESMHMVDKARGWRNHAAQMREEIFKLGMSADKKHLVSYSGEERVGPSLLRVAELGFLSEKDPVFAATVAEFENQWATSLDGSGVLLSTLLWYGEALRGVGRVKEAQSLFHAVCATSSETGLLTEAVDLKSGTLWGNGPATNAILAFLRLGSRLSRNWRSI